MSGIIFISYRRGDGGGSAGRLYDRLEQEFGRERVFFDVDTIAPGQDFVQVLGDKVDTCDVLLAVIGRSWLDARDEAGQRRLDSSEDFVRIEVAHALSAGKRVIPVLVDGAQVPNRESLPDDLKPLTRRNAVRVSHESFKADCDRLTRALQTAFGVPAAAHGTARASADIGRSDGRAATADRGAQAATTASGRIKAALGPTRRRLLAGGAAAAAAGGVALFWYPRAGRTTMDVEDALVLNPGGRSFDVNSADVHPKGDLVATGGSRKTVRLWNATTGALVADGVGHADRIDTVRFSPKEDQVRVLSAAHDMEARIWTGTNLEPFKVLPNRNPDAAPKETDVVDPGPIVAEWSPDATRIVTSAGNMGYTWDPETGKPLTELKGHRFRLKTVAFAPDGSYFATASLDGGLIVWPRDSAKSPTVVPAHADIVNDVSISPDSQLVATASFDKTAKLWKPAASSTPTHVLAHEEIVNSVSFAPHNGTVVTTSLDKTVCLWNALSGERVAVMRGHEESVLDARFSPDGAMIVSAGWDNTVRLWNALTGQPIAVLRGHKSTVRGAKFMPGGQRMLSWSDDGTARIWKRPAPAA